MTAEVFSETVCRLGEGPLWHPERQQLFWFDILGKRLLTRDGDGEQSWQFAEHVSAAGWVDRDRLLIASETALFSYDLATGAREDIATLEADRPETRSNDGRADPWGGFWIGTMGKAAEPGAGAIYRYYGGELRRLEQGVSIPNAICFAPDGRYACWCDTRIGTIMRQDLGADGWPEGPAEPFIDLSAEAFGPDGAVIDAEGCLWNAHWGGGQVARYGPDGALLSTHTVPAPHATCPSFGGADLTTLYVTTAAEPGDGRAAGLTYALAPNVRGQAEHRVKL